VPNSLNPMLFRGIPVTAHGNEFWVDPPSPFGYLHASAPAGPSTIATVQPGDPVWMIASYGGMMWIRPGTVSDVRKGRVYTDLAPPYGGCAWYQKSGKNAFAPKGQSFLVGDSFDFAGWWALQINRETEEKPHETLR